MVFQRLNYLECPAYTFTQLNCKMDNLIELKIFIEKHNGINDIRYKQMDEIEFPNLKELTICLRHGDIEFFKIEFS